VASKIEIVIAKIKKTVWILLNFSILIIIVINKKKKMINNQKIIIIIITHLSPINLNYIIILNSNKKIIIYLNLNKFIHLKIKL
jgi:hypothetical protein